MFFADYIYASPVKSFDLVTISWIPDHVTCIAKHWCDNLLIQWCDGTPVDYIDRA
jgi:hypothetical protein